MYLCYLSSSLFWTEYNKSLFVIRTSRIDTGHPVDAPCRDMDSHVIDAEAVLPFSRGAKYMDNHPSAVPANARGKKGREEGTRATGAPNAAKLITVPLRAYVHTDKARSSEVDPRRRRPSEISLLSDLPHRERSITIR